MSVERVIVFVLDDWRRPRGWRLAVSVAVVAALLVLGFLIVADTGGPPNPRIHVLYVGVIAAAFAFGGPGGLLAGLFAGLAAGPFASFAAPAPLEPDWFYRPIAFAFVGFLTGELMNLLNKRIEIERSMEEDLAGGYARTLRGFASVVAIRDEMTGGHCERVAANACEVGEALELPRHQVEALYWSGMLHDLGKVGVPETILLKPGALTAEEFKIIQDHAAMGATLVGSLSPAFEAIADGVRSHHERWDGEGYPLGLAGEQIPLFGRILAVVDNFEALTCERPYRQPMSSEDVIDYLRECAGTKFDPHLVPVFTHLWAEGRILVADERLEELDVPTLVSLQESLAISDPATFRTQDQTDTSVRGRPLSVPGLSHAWRRTWLSRRRVATPSARPGRASRRLAGSHR